MNTKIIVIISLIIVFFLVYFFYSLIMAVFYKKFNKINLLISIGILAGFLFILLAIFSYIKIKSLAKNDLFDDFPLDFAISSDDDSINSGATAGVGAGAIASAGYESPNGTSAFSASDKTRVIRELSFNSSKRFTELIRIKNFICGSLSNKPDNTKTIINMIETCYYGWKTAVELLIFSNFFIISNEQKRRSFIFKFIEQYKVVINILISLRKIANINIISVTNINQRANLYFIKRFAKKTIEVVTSSNKFYTNIMKIYNDTYSKNFDKIKDNLNNVLEKITEFIYEVPRDTFVRKLDASEVVTLATSVHALKINQQTP